MKLYHKIFKSRDDMSVYLENMDPLISYDEELFNRLTSARNTDELHDAKCAVLRDFHDIYTFDASDAEFPEPVGHFDDEGEKIKFIRKKISLQDIAFYLGSVYKKYHYIIYQTYNRLPEIELKRLTIDYNEIYRKAMEDYIAALVTGGQHAVTASFVLPSLIEQGLGVTLQNRMLFKCIMQLNDLTEEEKKVIEPFLHNDKVLFYGTEKFSMEKSYRLFVEKGETKNGVITLRKQVYISADYSESDGDKDVVDELNKWGNDDYHRVDFVDMSQVASGSVSKEPDCRICDLKAEFNSQINASSAVIFVVGYMTRYRTAGQSCGRVGKTTQWEAYCTPYKQNTNGTRLCKYVSTVPTTGNNVSSINNYSYLRHEFEQAARQKKNIIILYNSTRYENEWLPSYMSDYKNVARPFWITNYWGQRVGDYSYIKEALGF